MFSNCYSVLEIFLNCFYETNFDSSRVLIKTLIEKKNGFSHITEENSDLMSSYYMYLCNFINFN